MDMLGGSPESACCLTFTVYTFMARFRSRFRLCGATIPVYTSRGADGLNAIGQTGILSRAFGAAQARAPGGAPKAGCRFPNAVRRGELLVSGGDDRRGRTRVAAATGAIAPGASRSRRRDLRIAALAWLRPVAGPAA